MLSTEAFGKFTYSILLLAFALISQSSGAAAGDKTLKAKEVRALFPGKYEAKVRGYKIAVVAKRNGSLAGSVYSHTDKGRWWVKGNRLCVAWSNWTNGKPTCGYISRSGGWYVSHNGSGNPMRFRRN